MQTVSGYRLLAASALLWLAGGCGSGAEVATTEVVGSAAQGASSAARAQVERPYKGRCETRFEITAPVMQGDQPVGFLVHLSGTCQLTHLGRTTLEAEQQVLFVGPATQAVTNTATLIAANGDTLRSAFDGTGTPILADPANPQSVIGFEFSGTDTYSAGTGRFSQASGAAALTGAAQFDTPATEGAPPTTGSGQYEVSGTIAY